MTTLTLRATAMTIVLFCLGFGGYLFFSTPRLSIENRGEKIILRDRSSANGWITYTAASDKKLTGASMPGSGNLTLTRREYTIGDQTPKQEPLGFLLRSSQEAADLQKDFDKKLEEAGKVGLFDRVLMW